MAEQKFDNTLRPVSEPEGGFPRSAEDRRKTARIAAASTRDEYVTALMEEHGVTRLQAEATASYVFD